MKTFNFTGEHNGKFFKFSTSSLEDMNIKLLELFDSVCDGNSVNGVVENEFRNTLCVFDNNYTQI